MVGTFHLKLIRNILPLLGSQLLLRGDREFSRPNAELLISLRGFQTAHTVTDAKQKKIHKVFLSLTQYALSPIFVKIGSRKLKMLTFYIFTLCFLMFRFFYQLWVWKVVTKLTECEESI